MNEIMHDKDERTITLESEAYYVIIVDMPVELPVVETVNGRTTHRMKRHIVEHYYGGTSKSFAFNVRTKYGRKLSDAKRWKTRIKAIAALDKLMAIEAGNGRGVRNGRVVYVQHTNEVHLTVWARHKETTNHGEAQV